MSLLNEDPPAWVIHDKGLRIRQFDDGAMAILDLDAPEGERTAMHLSPGKALQLRNFVRDLTQLPTIDEPPQPDTKASNPKDAIGTRKAPMSTVPIRVIAELGVAMLEGAAKYGRHNYRAVGVRASVYFDACMRHLFAWFEGENIDADSQLSHVTKAIASLVVLRDSMMQRNWVDDRPPAAVPFYPAFNARAVEVLDRHADKDPHHYTIASECSHR